MFAFVHEEFVRTLEPTETAMDAPSFNNVAVSLIKFALFAHFLKICYHNCPYFQVFVDAILSPWRMKFEAMTSVVCRDPFASCCPKRKARYWKCAKRRRRRAHKKQNQTQDDPQDDYECPLSKFCKLHLPAPLPFVRRRHRQKSREAALDKDCIPEVTSTPQDFSNSSVSESASEASDNKVALQTASLVSIPPNVRAPKGNLIDLARMQQWQTILSLPQLKRREAKYRDGDGLYPLHWAAAGGPPVAVLKALLVAYPSAAHKIDAEGSTSLHFATHYAASADAVAVLVQAYPAAVRRQDKYGRTPLYHASDKSASLDVLKLLAWEDPAMITTPCHVPNRTNVKLETHATSSRELAVRTPLFLVWARVLSDRHTRLNRRGKIWEKALWMLQASYQHHHSAVTTVAGDETRLLLTASIVMDVYLPEQVVSLMIASYPELLRIPDTVGQLPLSTAASAAVYSHERQDTLLRQLLDAYPAAACYRNVRTGRSALLEAIASGHTWTSVFEELRRAAPSALMWKDGKTSLPPALLAAQVAPDQQSVKSSKTSQSLTALDPFNLLTRKQHELVEQSSGSTDSSSGKITAVNSETMQLGTIFALLKANPTQIHT